MNLPNKITIARIMMIFIFLVICNIDDYLPEGISKVWRLTALVFAILAGITDILDGYIARKYNMITDFGRLMDPLADKIFMATTFIMLVDKGILAGWVAVVVLSREFLVTGLRLLATNKGEVISADVTGKLKTSLQMAFLVIGGSFWVMGYNREALKINYIYGIKLYTLWQISVSIIIFITVYSGLNYFIRFRHLYLTESNKK